MHNKNPIVSTAIPIAILMILSACATEQSAVVENLDELTAVTITHARTPIILSPETPLDSETVRDYAQIGAIEINRMGSLQYFLWLGISEVDQLDSADERPEGYESITLFIDGQSIPLDLIGWTHNAIGTSAPVYKKLFQTSVDAYYEVDLAQIQLMNDADVIEFHTSDAPPKRFVSWYRQSQARDDLAEFVQTVTQ